MSVSQYEVIQSHINKFKDMLYTSSPAEVVTVNKVGDYIESVDVYPSVARVYRDGDIRPKSKIYKVPLVFPSGGGGLLSFPISVGDTVLLIFAGDDNENFLNGSSVVPKTYRKFSYNDAIAIPCLYPLQSNLEPSSTKVELKYRGSSISIAQNGDIDIKDATNVTISGVTNVSIEGATDVTIESEEINLTATQVNISGELRVDGGVSTGGDVSTDDGVSLNEHKHKLVKAGTDVSGEPE